MSKKKDRQKMKDVRSDVKHLLKAMKNNEYTGFKHLGEYPRDMETAVRTIIALQDTVEDSQDRHSKATAEIARLKSDYESYQEVIGVAMEMRGDMYASLSEDHKKLKTTIEQLTQDINSYCDDNQILSDRLLDMTAQWEVEGRKRITLLDTIRIMNGEAPVERYIPVPGPMGSQGRDGQDGSSHGPTV